MFEISVMHISYRQNVFEEIKNMQFREEIHFWNMTLAVEFFIAISIFVYLRNQEPVFTSRGIFFDTALDYYRVQ